MLPIEIARRGSGSRPKGGMHLDEHSQKQMGGWNVGDRPCVVRKRHRGDGAVDSPRRSQDASKPDGGWNCVSV